MTLKVHGIYQWSNSCGYGIHLSDDGEQAKLIISVEDCIATDWLDIEYVFNEETGEFEPIIDPLHYNVPLSQVLKVS